MKNDSKGKQQQVQTIRQYKSDNYGLQKIKSDK